MNASNMSLVWYVHERKGGNLSDYHHHHKLKNLISNRSFAATLYYHQNDCGMEWVAIEEGNSFALKALFPADMTPAQVIGMVSGSLKMSNVYRHNTVIELQLLVSLVGGGVDLIFNIDHSLSLYFSSNVRKVVK
mmetsp:Transcript_8880/g.12951  ORF Transcript_8880/g.12951 Transcript_8880/m.12951 type:complete len:134 (+) Transcript_8880:233-634(+)